MCMYTHTKWVGSFVVVLVVFLMVHIMHKKHVVLLLNILSRAHVLQASTRVCYWTIVKKRRVRMRIFLLFALWMHLFLLSLFFVSFSNIYSLTLYRKILFYVHLFCLANSLSVVNVVVLYFLILYSPRE